MDKIPLMKPLLEVGVHLIPNRLGVAELDVRDRMKLRRLMSEANIVFRLLYRSSNLSVCRQTHLPPAFPLVLYNCSVFRLQLRKLHSINDGGQSKKNKFLSK